MNEVSVRRGEGQRWVIKLGSALLAGTESGLNLSLISSLVDTCVHLRHEGIEPVLVSSGAIAQGMSRLGWQVRPHELYRLQAAAAVGQMGLVQAYQQAFEKFGVHTAQVLLTGADLNDRPRNTQTAP